MLPRLSRDNSGVQCQEVGLLCNVINNVQDNTNLVNLLAQITNNVRRYSARLLNPIDTLNGLLDRITPISASLVTVSESFEVSFALVST